MNYDEFFSHSRTSRQYSAAYVQWFVAGIVCLFAVTLSPINFVTQWYDRLIFELQGSGYLTSVSYGYLIANKERILLEYIVPFRRWLFFLSLLITAYPLIGDCIDHIVKHSSVYKDRKTYTDMIIPFAVLCILIIPSQLALGGIVYAKISTDPFNFADSQMWFYQRSLMPAIAYFLQLKGPFLYYFYSMFVTVGLFLLVQIFFRTRGITLSKLELISVGTSSFIMTQLQAPGYTEQLALVFLLILFLVPTGTLGRIGLSALSLLAHEISIVPIVFVAWLYFSKKEQAMVAAVIVVYCFFWIASFGGDIPYLLSVRNVDGKSGMQWAVEHPYRLILGIVLSFKILWTVIIYGAVKAKEDRILIMGFIGIAVVFTFMGVDTSRLMGFGMLALLISLYYAREYFIAKPVLYRYLLTSNIIVPSFFVGTNIGIALINGVYDVNGSTSKFVFNGLYHLLYFGAELK